MAKSRLTISKSIQTNLSRGVLPHSSCWCDTSTTDTARPRHQAASATLPAPMLTESVQPLDGLLCPIASIQLCQKRPQNVLISPAPTPPYRQACVQLPAMVRVRIMAGLLPCLAVVPRKEDSRVSPSTTATQWSQSHSGYRWDKCCHHCLYSRILWSMSARICRFTMAASSSLDLRYS